MIIINENKLIKGSNQKELLSRLKTESENKYSIIRVKYNMYSVLYFEYAFNIKNRNYVYYLFSCNTQFNVEDRISRNQNNFIYAGGYEIMLLFKSINNI